jgi:protein phosphatase
MRITVGTSSDVGRVREANEDSYLVADPLYAVADGMGGHLAGDVASGIAVSTIKTKAEEKMPATTDELAELLRIANRNIWERSQSDPGVRGMGTTTTLVKLEGDQAHLAHVGDSRAYLFSDGELSQITEDHTLVSRMVREGRLRPEEAERHPQRSIITRALGVDSDVDVDSITLTVKPGDRILLCSDGLTSMIGESEIRDVLASEPDPQRAADRLVELANAAGGEDNITVVILAFEEGQQTRTTSTTSDASPETASSPPAPVRYETPVAAGPAAEAPSWGPTSVFSAASIAPKRRWPRALALTLLVIVVLGAGAFFGTRYALSNSYFVGSDDEGYITIYRGRPEEIAGFALRDEEERTDLKVTDLPEFLRADIETGIKVDSLEEAQAKVSDLQARASDTEFGGNGKRKNGPN